MISYFFSRYVEETAASGLLNIPVQRQLADINSVFASSEKTAITPVTLSTIQGNSIVSRGTILTDLIDAGSDRGNQINTYTVQEGDTLSFIASDYGVSVNTIIWANNLKSPDDIKPGMDLKIPPVTGVIHKVRKGDTVASIAKKYGVDQGKIISFNSLPQQGDLQIDEELIVPDGKPVAEPKNPAPTKTGTAKRFAQLPNLGGFYSAPTAGYNWGIIHGRNGIDVANSCGTPIYAAADGTVTLASVVDPLGRTGRKMNGGYGKYLKISHPNGTETLYAHTSSILVSAGEEVQKGQQIALMGTTGRSTGCHLHFEVHGARNPMARY